MWWKDSPIWNTVGTHLRFSPHILSITTALLRKTLGLPPIDPSTTSTTDTPLPPLITIHIRRNDFTVWCGDHTRDDCLAPLSAYIRRVDQVTQELLKTHPTWTKEDIKVVVMTDEPRVTPEKDAGNNEKLEPGTSEGWWKSVEDEGWLSIRHDDEGTVEEYGAW